MPTVNIFCLEMPFCGVSTRANPITDAMTLGRLSKLGALDKNQEKRVGKIWVGFTSPTGRNISRRCACKNISHINEDQLACCRLL